MIPGAPALLFLFVLVNTCLSQQTVPDAPPVANGGPDIVVQPNEAVTLNGIQSKDDKGIVTYEWQMLSPYPFAVIEKTIFPDQVLVSNLTAGRYKFNLTVIDTIGQSDITVVTVLVLTPELSMDKITSTESPVIYDPKTPMKEEREICTETPDTGTCRESSTKWYYDPYQEDCFPFNYSGCGGNENKFDRKNYCQSFCRGVNKADVFSLLNNKKENSGRTGNLTGVTALKVICILVHLAFAVGYFFVRWRGRYCQNLPVLIVQNTMAEGETDSAVYKSTTNLI